MFKSDKIVGNNKISIVMFILYIMNIYNEFFELIILTKIKVYIIFTNFSYISK